MKATLFGVTWFCCLVVFGFAACGHKAGTLALVGFVALIWVLASGVQLFCAALHGT